MNGLSFGVIRVDTEEKLSVLTVQDVGQVLPGGKGRAGVCPVPQLLDVSPERSGLRGSALQAHKQKASEQWFPMYTGVLIYSVICSVFCLPLY